MIAPMVRDMALLVWSKASSTLGGCFQPVPGDSVLGMGRRVPALWHFHLLLCLVLELQIKPQSK